MTDDENQAAAALAPRGWRNYTRSRRAHELRRDFAATDEDMTPTDWWLEDTEQEPTE